MAIVGIIEKGTIGSLLHSLRDTGSDVVLVAEREDQIGRVVSLGGEVKRAFISSISEARTLCSDHEAILELEGWQQGVYSLLSWGTFEELSGARLLIVAEQPQQAALEQQFAVEGFKSDVVAQHGEVVELTRLLQPDVVVVTCPRAMQAMNCEQVRAELEAACPHNTPLLVTSTPGCTQDDCPHLAIKRSSEQATGQPATGYSPSQLCQPQPLSVEDLSTLIRQHWQPKG